jgi:hypothetical protein
MKRCVADLQHKVLRTSSNVEESDGHHGPALVKELPSNWTHLSVRRSPAGQANLQHHAVWMFVQQNICSDWGHRFILLQINVVSEQGQQYDYIKAFRACFLVHRKYKFCFHSNHGPLNLEHAWKEADFISIPTILLPTSSVSVSHQTCPPTNKFGRYSHWR